MSLNNMFCKRFQDSLDITLKTKTRLNNPIPNPSERATMIRRKAVGVHKSRKLGDGSNEDSIFELWILQDPVDEDNVLGGAKYDDLLGEWNETQFSYLKKSNVYFPAEDENHLLDTIREQSMKILDLQGMEKDKKDLNKKARELGFEIEGLRMKDEQQRKQISYMESLIQQDEDLSDTIREQSMKILDLQGMEKDKKDLNKKARELGFEIEGLRTKDEQQRKQISYMESLIQQYSMENKEQVSDFDYFKREQETKNLEQEKKIKDLEDQLNLEQEKKIKDLEQETKNLKQEKKIKDLEDQLLEFSNLQDKSGLEAGFKNLQVVKRKKVKKHLFIVLHKSEEQDRYLTDCSDGFDEEITKSIGGSGEKNELPRFYRSGKEVESPLFSQDIDGGEEIKLPGLLDDFDDFDEAEEIELPDLEEDLDGEEERENPGSEWVFGEGGGDFKGHKDYFNKIIVKFFSVRSWDPKNMSRFIAKIDEVNNIGLRNSKYATNEIYWFKSLSRELGRSIVSGNTRKLEPLKDLNGRYLVRKSVRKNILIGGRYNMRSIWEYCFERQGQNYSTTIGRKSRKRKRDYNNDPDKQPPRKKIKI